MDRVVRRGAVTSVIESNLLIEGCMSQYQSPKKKKKTVLRLSTWVHVTYEFWTKKSFYTTVSHGMSNMSVSLFSPFHVTAAFLANQHHLTAADDTSNATRHQLLAETVHPQAGNATVMTKTGLLILAGEAALLKSSLPTSFKMSSRFLFDISQLRYQEVTRMSDEGSLFSKTGLCRKWAAFSTASFGTIWCFPWAILSGLLLMLLLHLVHYMRI